MDLHSIVIVSLHSPKEKAWGELLAINPSGVTLRGIDLNSFDHVIFSRASSAARLRNISGNLPEAFAECHFQMPA